MDIEKNLEFTRRTPCATRCTGSRKALTTEGGPVPGSPRERGRRRATGELLRSLIPGGRRAAHRPPSHRLASAPSGAEAPPSHTWRGLRCSRACPAGLRLPPHYHSPSRFACPVVMVAMRMITPHHCQAYLRDYLGTVERLNSLAIIPVMASLFPRTALAPRVWRACRRLRCDTDRDSARAWRGAASGAREAR